MAVTLDVPTAWAKSQRFWSNWLGCSSDMTNNSTLCLHHDCSQATSQAEGKHMNFLNGLKSHWVGLGPAALLNPLVHSLAYSLGQWFLTSSSLLKPPTPLALSLFSAKDVKPSLTDKIGKKVNTPPSTYLPAPCVHTLPSPLWLWMECPHCCQRPKLPLISWSPFLSAIITMTLPNHHLLPLYWSIPTSS